MGIPYQLVVVELGSAMVDCEPPGGSTDSGAADVDTDSHVSEEQPSADEGFLGAAGHLEHDVQIRGVEAEGGGGQTVSDQVDPQQLYGDQGFRHTKGSGQEDTGTNIS